MLPSSIFRRWIANYQAKRMVHSAWSKNFLPKQDISNLF